ncbi:hypothetical protein [Candidatus Nitrosocosmicus hydrocola]|uniref:hypothetical protein n=1 Tax=Candidatus Nitrosocosmicus hydrocola TaxID=1826872 RepID=UPI0011E5DB3D|nr:hypothetical protein [Candidatus Nitrosocosmicus hydrocola]
MTIIISKDDKFLKILQSNLQELYKSRRRKPGEKVHVSDILPGSCLRKAFFSRVSDTYKLTGEDIDNFVRGESSEYALVQLANMGVSQYELLFEEELIARPDLITMKQKEDSSSSGPDSERTSVSSEIIVEFKDTKSLERLTPNSSRFRSYLRQLLYYLVISNYDTGILCIRYSNNRNLIWIKSDSAGDYYFSPKNNLGEKNGERLSDIETWTVIMEKNSPTRNLLKNEIRSRVSLLKSALIENSVYSLPRVAEEWKCKRCPFLVECNPSSVKKKDSKSDFLLENGSITVISQEQSF